MTSMVFLQSYGPSIPQDDRRAAWVLVHEACHVISLRVQYNPATALVIMFRDFCSIDTPHL